MGETSLNTNKQESSGIGLSLLSHNKNKVFGISDTKITSLSKLGPKGKEGFYAKIIKNEKPQIENVLRFIFPNSFNIKITEKKAALILPLDLEIKEKINQAPDLIIEAINSFVGFDKTKVEDRELDHFEIFESYGIKKLPDLVKVACYLYSQKKVDQKSFIEVSEAYLTSKYESEIKQYLNDFLSKYPLEEGILEKVKSHINDLTNDINTIANLPNSRVFQADDNYLPRRDKNFALWTKVFAHLGLKYDKESFEYSGDDKAVEQINIVKKQFAELKKVILYLYVEGKLDEKTCFRLINISLLKQLCNSTRLLTPRAFR